MHNYTITNFQLNPDNTLPVSPSESMYCSIALEVLIGLGRLAMMMSAWVYTKYGMVWYIRLFVMRGLGRIRQVHSLSLTDREVIFMI